MSGLEYMDSDKYCRSCCDSVIRGSLFADIQMSRVKINSEMPAWLLDLHRMKVAGIRLTRLELNETQVDILKEIIKTKDHESHSIAQIIIRNFNGSKAGKNRTPNG